MERQHNDDGLIEFVEDLHQDVIYRAEVEGEQTLRPAAFTALIVDTLIEIGEIEDGEESFFTAPRRGEVSGYGIQDEGATLNLFITIYRHQGALPAPINASEIERTFSRLLTFYKWARDGEHISIEEASPIFDMIERIKHFRKDYDRVRLFLFTDGISRLEYKNDEQLDGATISYHIWDVRRLHRAKISGQRGELIYIDFEQDFGKPIPCLAAPITAPDYSTYLAILPGDILGSIYDRYGPRLLELNVRSFLQARGKVNQGIRKTILDEPERFLAYNNGISATAEKIELVGIPGQGIGIKSVTGLQIVNGGQTTASIYYAAKKDRDKADVARVFVQMKLTIINETNAGVIVPLISRFANSQNKVNEADFSANDPFHVRMEELSRSIWAPATGGTQRQTRWFYERAHGQYQDAINREGTLARKKQFKLSHPNMQRFTKTDLAKFENTWDQLPYLVSLGAQKNFSEFTLRLADRGRFEPDAGFFKRHIARAILFKQAEKIVSEQRFGGYRANIVPYTISYINHHTASSIDLIHIWDDQSISPALADTIRLVSYPVKEAIVNPPGGQNIGEWCKKKACWDRIRELDVQFPDALEVELIPVAGREAQGSSDGINSLTPAERKEIHRVAEVEGKVWHELWRWAKDTGHLEPWQRSLARRLGTKANNGYMPSYKEAIQGKEALQKAVNLGFRSSIR